MIQMIPTWLDGTLTPVEKLEAHQRGLKHQAVSVFVMAERRVLIQRRALTKYHTPGLWANSCCTHPLWGEPPETCALRRLHEELGITGLPVTHRDRVEYRADVGNGLTEHEVVDIYLSAASPGLRVVPNPAEVMEVRWVGLRDLAAEIAAAPDRFTPWLRIYLAEHSDSIFGTLARA